MVCLLLFAVNKDGLLFYLFVFRPLHGVIQYWEGRWSQSGG